MATSSRPTRADALREAQALFDHLQHIVDLAGRVLAKFPANTIPDGLRPLLGSPRVELARPSNDEIILNCQRRSLTGDRVTVRMPGAWLQMRDDEITSAVRDMYWGDKLRRDRRELEKLANNIEQHKAHIERHTRELARDQERHDRLKANLEKKHRTRD